MRGPDAPAVVNLAVRCFAPEASIMTMTNLPPLAETLRLITAAYFVADATERKHFNAIFRQLQSLTEYELAKLASRKKASSRARKTASGKRKSRAK